MLRTLKPTKNSASASRPLMLLGAMLMSLPLAGCQTLGSATRYLDTSCGAFRPITYSSRDTAETVKQVRGHNAAFDALCPATQPKGP